MRSMVEGAALYGRLFFAACDSMSITLMCILHHMFSSAILPLNKTNV
ncbi:hypothetical protein HMPREF1992_02079 [Selenomonas sp. oral taxon 892 str. F0426]|nr:hypothetical protein HMPREF1992_02079 [Selenomonas sp. oral taxon 892 str. F0426]